MNIKRLDINLSIQYLLDNYIEVHQPHNFYCKSNGLYKHGSYAWIVCENRVFIDIKLPQILKICPCHAIILLLNLEKYQ